MSEPWIRVHANLAAKPVVWRAVEELDLKGPHAQHIAIGLLVALWGKVSQFQVDGVIGPLPDGQIEAWADWHGKRGRFAAFIRQHHIDGDGRLREWNRYASHLQDRHAISESPDGKTSYVYYAVDGDECKIGYSGNPWARVNELRVARPRIQLAATEKGRRALEMQRHEQFASAHLDREWFKLTDELRTFIASVVTTSPPTSPPTKPSVASRANETKTKTETNYFDPDADGAPEADGAVIGEPALTELYLTVWANGAITERWGEQPNPLTRGSHATLLAEELRALGVEWEVARLSIYEQCRKSKNGRPPSTVNYFRNGIVEAWNQERARRDLAASGERPPLHVASRPRVNPGAQQVANILGGGR